MARRIRKKPPVGARPGTLVIDSSAPKPQIKLILFSPDQLRETVVDDVSTLAGVVESSDCAWVDVQGLGDGEVLGKLGKLFSVHPLALEDVVHVPIRPKAEAYQEHLLIISRMLQLGANLDLSTEQVSILVGRNYVLTFQERYGDVLDPVRARLKAGNPMIRSGGPGYLTYAILDTIVDAYFPVIDQLADELEEMEERVMTDPSAHTLRSLNRLKRILVRVRRAVSPQREAVNSLLRGPSAFLPEETKVFLRDTYDHCVSSAEAVETSREFVNGLMNTYLTVVSNRMNEVMKTLTIVASIFVPLTFMAGIYGMNFESMPELGVGWAYPTLLVSMALVAVGMIAYFHRKGWISFRSDPEDDADD